MRVTIIFTLVIACSGCGSIVPFSRDISKPESAGSSPAPPLRDSNDGLSDAALEPQLATCVQTLARSGAQFVTLPDTLRGPGCNQVGAVQLTLLRSDRSTIAVSDMGALSCNAARAFNDWARYGVDRAARQILRQTIVKVETLGSFACRDVAGTGRRSAHATAGAVDVSGFVLASGRYVSVKRDWEGGDGATREFLRIVFKSACKRFTTVLGPAYDAAHADHFHLELGSSKFCR